MYTANAHASGMPQAIGWCRSTMDTSACAQLGRTSALILRDAASAAGCCTTRAVDARVVASTGLVGVHSACAALLGAVVIPVALVTLCMKQQPAVNTHALYQAFLRQLTSQIGMMAHAVMAITW